MKKIVFDLDGTICFSGKPLSPAMIQALATLEGIGFDLIFASARPIRDLLPILPVHMHHYPMVGGNGAFVALGGEIITTSPFDKETLGQLICLITKYEAKYLMDGEWDYAYTGDDTHPIRRNLDPEGMASNLPYEQLGGIVKMVVLSSLNPGQLLVELQKLPVITYMHGSEDIIDISPRGVNKWEGLQVLGVRSQEFIAFGNDANDISMFQQAGRSICVGDHPELKRFATEQVMNIEERVIEKIGEMVLTFNR
ncbi:HAD family phosphatase [Paenibacillus sp. 1011MAR3C5]|uniref:HAD-IIB family hydrolase n=1 Tax=Paenibacillus sp. 1011MAR3C5 TaxID=1675787 RepID=UPI000E6C9399|nr:HAD family hydrolase [Paenibacillus sp. 1011MAR3C5]RJE86995.1 HAD family phosphatase [Paenibacillus sp. 1011MAR3C5]